MIARSLISVVLIALTAGPALGQAARPGTVPAPPRTPPVLTGPPTGLPRVNQSPPADSSGGVPTTPPGTTAPPPARTPPVLIGPPTGLPTAPAPNEPRSDVAPPDSIVGGSFTTGTLGVDPRTGLVVDPSTGLLRNPKTALLLDPRTAAAIDPSTGQSLTAPAVDPRTGLLVDTRSGFVIQPGSGMLINPATGTLIDPRSLSPSTTSSGR